MFNRFGARGILSWMSIALSFGSIEAFAQTNPVKAPNSQEIALAHHYDCVERYAQKYARTAASSGDIADAATSFCSEQLKAFSMAMTAQFGGGQVATVDSLTESIRARGRDFGVQTALEAKYPIK